MSDEFLNNRIQALTPEYRDVVLSDFVEVASQEIGATYHLDKESVDACENMIFLYLLLIINKYELVEALVTECELSIPNATAAVESTLAKLPTEMVASAEAAYLEVTENETAVSEKDRYSILSKLPSPRQAAYVYAKINGLLSASNLTEEQLGKGQVLLGDIILGFYKLEDTVPLLQQELGLEPKTAALLGAEVIEFLTPLTNPSWQPPATPTSPVAGVAQTTIPVKSPALFEVPAEPVVPPAPVYQPAPTPEPVYQSTQPVVAPAPQLTTIPSYAPTPTPPAVVTPPPAPDRPRWSTEI